MEIIKQIPFLDALLVSKKAKMLAVLVSLFLMRDQLGLGSYELKYLTLGFCAYFIAQGMKDVGEQIAGWWSSKEEQETAEPPVIVPEPAVAPVAPGVEK